MLVGSFSSISLIRFPLSNRLPLMDKFLIPRDRTYCRSQTIVGGLRCSFQVRPHSRTPAVALLVGEQQQRSGVSKKTSLVALFCCHRITAVTILPLLHRHHSSVVISPPAVKGGWIARELRRGAGRVCAAAAGLDDPVCRAVCSLDVHEVRGRL